MSSGSTQLAAVDQAPAGSSVNTAGLGTELDSHYADAAAPAGEMVVQAAAAGANSGARGAGLELGIGATSPQLTPAIALTERATATAPPNSGLISKQIGPLALDPVINATLLQGQAQARWNNGNCVLGADISRGFGHLATAGVVGTPQPPVAAAPGDATSESREVIVPQTDKSGATLGSGVGLMSVVKQTIAPVALLGGAVTINVIGPVTVAAVATGVPGGAYILSGPPPIVRIDTPAGPGTPITLGPSGLNVPVVGVGIVSVGTPVHAIGGDPTTSKATEATDGTSASGAIDIVRVSAGLGGTLGIADVRIGHVEVSATVPAGGIICQVDVSKTATPTNVNPGDKFTYTITVHNPHSCVLTGVKVVDTITVTSGVRYTILGQNPAANSVVGGVLTWNDIGPIQPDETKTITVDMQVAKNSAGGTFTEKADVTASCAIGSAQGGATISVPASGSVTIQLPTINGGAGRALPVTGGLTDRYYAVALVIGLVALVVGRRGLKAFFSKT